MKIDRGRPKVAKVPATQLPAGTVFRTESTHLYLVVAYGNVAGNRYFVRLLDGVLLTASSWTDYELLPDAKLVCGDPA